METVLIHLKKTLFIVTIVTISFSNLNGQERNYIALSTAVFDILQQSDPSFETRAEFRFGKVSLLAHPFSGVMVNTEGAMHIYLGLYYDIQLTDLLFITPSFAPGLYAKNKSKDLNFALEFQSQIEVSLKLTNGSRVGISFNHISNATFGKENPGVESLALTYIISL